MLNLGPQNLGVGGGGLGSPDSATAVVKVGSKHL